MAFSLLDHLQNSCQASLQALVPAMDGDGQRALLAIVLGQLMVLDRANSTAWYQAMAAQDYTLFWQGLDEQAIHQLAATTALTVAEFKNVIDQLSAATTGEIYSLDRTASLGQAGVSELIQGQAEYLAGSAPDQVWHVLNLKELQGQNAPAEAAVDLNASIASLNKMMMDASQMTTQPLDATPQPDLAVQQQDQSHSPASIALPAQRPAARLFLVLEPLIALLILLALWLIYTQLTR